MNLVSTPAASPIAQAILQNRGAQNRNRGAQNPLPLTRAGSLRLLPALQKDRVDIRFGGLTEYEEATVTLAREVDEAYDRLLGKRNRACWENITCMNDRTSARLNQAIKELDEFGKNQKARDILWNINWGAVHDPDLRRYLRMLVGMIRPVSAGSGEELTPEDALAQNTQERVAQLQQQIQAWEAGLEGTHSERNREPVNAAEARQKWEARYSKGSFKTANGSTTAERLIEIVKLRNEMARRRGYPDYYSMAENTTRLSGMLSYLKLVTEQPYREIRKAQVEEAVKRYGISEQEALLPWFFDALKIPIPGFDPESYLKGVNPLPLIEETARRMGKSVEQIIRNSDLFSDPTRPEKASGNTIPPRCFNMGTPGDVRVFANINPEFQSNMENTFRMLLHEMIGHGLNFLDIRSDLAPAMRHLYLNLGEGEAMMMEELVHDREWLETVLKLPEAELKIIAPNARLFKKAQTLVQLRQTLMRVHFEKEMYANPDQDLNRLWYNLQELYLLVKTPPDRNEPDWTSVSHYVDSPAYYRYYLFGEAYRAQLKACITKNFGSLLSPEAGDFLKKYHAIGRLYPEEQLFELMTGKPADLDALVDEFKDFKFKPSAS